MGAEGMAGGNVWCSGEPATLGHEEKAWWWRPPVWWTVEKMKIR